MTPDKKGKPVKSPAQKRAEKSKQRKEWTQAEIDAALVANGGLPKAGPNHKAGPGAPLKLEGVDLERVEALAASGLTKMEIAKSLGCGYDTLRVEQNENPAFSAAIDRGRAKTAAMVENALFRKAQGYSHPEDKIFLDSQTGQVVIQPTLKHYPPDTAAALAILQKIESGSWKSKTEITLIEPIAGKLQKARERAKRV